MPTADIYGFKHEDMTAARRAIENALSICLEEAEEAALPEGAIIAGSFQMVHVCSSAAIQAHISGGRVIPQILGIQILGC